ncbi:hypothetical protein P3S67_014910 [Capsicum chacoense]
MKITSSRENKKSECDRPPLSAQAEPWFVIFHGDEMQNHTFFSISEDRYYTRSIPELQTKKICAYAREWLVLFDYYTRDYHLWNAVCNDKIQLPPLPSTTGHHKLQCFLSAPLHDPECRLLFIDEPSSLLYFIKPGYNEEFHKQDLRQIIGDSHLTLWTVFKGKFYGLVQSMLVHLDLDNDSGIVTTTPMASKPLYDKNGEFLDMPIWDEYLIQSSCDDDQNNNDMLLCVHKLCTGWHLSVVYGFLVFRFDFAKATWVEMKSIGDNAIFLHGSRGTICSTRDNNNLKKDSIYFIQGRRLCVFNLATKCRSQSLPCPTISKKLSRFYWLKLPSICN